MRWLALLVAIVLFALLVQDAHARLGPVHVQHGATSYCGAQPDAIGGRARFGTVAVRDSTEWLFRRKIYVIGGIRNPYGRPRHWFRVVDHIGKWSVMDFFTTWGAEPDCAWGRRTIRYRVAR